MGSLNDVTATEEREKKTASYSVLYFSFGGIKIYARYFTVFKLKLVVVAVKKLPIVLYSTYIIIQVIKIII